MILMDLGNTNRVYLAKIFIKLLKLTSINVNNSNQVLHFYDICEHTIERRYIIGSSDNFEIV